MGGGPAGLAVNASLQLEGTPTVAQAATTYTWRATDADGDTAELTFTIEVQADTDPAFGSGVTIGNQVYVKDVAIAALQLPAASGGNAPLTHELVGGGPAGLAVNASLQLEGTPTVAQAATTYTWRATDADGDTAELTFTIEVQADTDPAFGSGVTIGNQVYVKDVAIAALQLPAASGGNAPLTHELVGGGPAGLAVNASLQLEGTPTVAQAATTYTWRATDADGDTAELTFTIEVQADTDPAFGSGVTIGNQVYVKDVAIAALQLPAASGGNAPLTHELVGGGPAGLAVNASLQLEGTPTVAQAATTYTWRATDADGDTAELTFTIEVQADTDPAFGSGVTIGNQVYVKDVAIAALQLPAASGGNAPLTHELVGGGPAGLAVNASLQLEGTPTVAQAATTYTWRATDADGDTAELTFTIEVQADTDPAFGSGVTIGNQVYVKDVAIAALQLPAASGGNAPLTHELVGGGPAGLAVNASLQLEGTPTVAQAATTYTWRATDADGDTAELTFTIEVQADTDPAFGSGVTIGNQVYVKDVAIAALQLPAASGGNAPLTHELVGGGPAGLAVNASLQLEGTPTVAQAATTYTWRATDADGDTAELTFTIEVQADTDPAFGSGVTIGNQVYVKDVAIAALQLPAASGGNAPLTHELVGGGPAGLAVNASLQLEGTPTVAQAATTYTWRATDADGDTAELTFTIEVQADTDPAFGSGVTIGNQVYVKDVAIAALQLPAASGGNAPLTHELVGGGPAGLAVNASLQLEGTPTVAQAATTYTWRATDADGDTAELTFTIEVQADTDPAFGSGVTIGNQVYVKDVAIAALQLPAASGGNAPLTHELVGGGPAGLAVNASLQLEGTPTVAQAATTYTWRATDADGDTAELTFTIEVQADTDPAFGSGVTIGNQVYVKDVAIAALQLPAASGGNAPLTHELVGGGPAGLAVNASLQLEGTPTVAQAATTYTWRATDADGDTAELTFTIEVQADTDPAFGSGVTIGNQVYVKDVAIAALQLPAASGGNAPLTHELVGGGPAGLAVNASLQLEGTPTVAQAATTYTWRATDADGDTAELTFTIEVQADTDPAFGSGVTIGNQVYVKDVAIAALQLPAASGGNAPLTHELVGGGPAGLAVNASLQLEGTPTVAQAATTYTWRATDADGDTAELTFTIEVQADTDPAFGSGVTIGNQVYVKDVAIAALQLPAASGGNAPLTHELVGGGPAGLAVNASLQLEGTPTVAQAATTYTWRATDADGDTAELTFTIEVQADTDPAFGSGVTIGNQVYVKDVAIAALQLPAASGGNAPLTHELVGGGPAGLAVNASLQLEGTPTVAQAATTYTWRATDADGDTAELTFTIEVQADTDPAFGSGVTIGNQVYVKDVAIAALQLPAASGGNAPLTHELVGGGPAGLAVNASLQLEGTPTVAQAATTYTWRATDADGDTAELTFTIEVQADTDPAFGSGVTIGNQVYVKDVAIAALQLPAASGGNAPLTHELVGGGPAGLAVNASLQLEGTPTVAQAATTYTWRATDADGDTAELTFTIEVQADTDPAFGSGVTIGNQVYVKDVAIAALQLPAASGGNAPLTHELVGGGPAGLAVNASLQLEGTPTVAQAATTYTWRATDADGDTAELTFTIEVQADTDPAFGSGVTIGNQVYVKDVAIAALQLPAASGGNAPLTHELVGGGPAGLAVNASLQLEGTPTVAQAATTYTWRATDADGDTAELTFTIEVQADTDPAFGSGVTIGNQVYVKDVAIAALQLPAASGGNAPLTHELVGGGPAGLAVNASLQLEGTPTVAQAATTYTWRATDADGDTAELTFTIEVQADTDPAFGSGVTIGNQVYVKDVAIAALQLPAASGGNAPLTHELVGGGPAGLAVNASLQLEGTPTVAQAATTYTWRATDADGDTAELTFTIEVQADTDPAFGSGVTIGNQVYVKDVAIAALQLPAASGGNAPLTHELVGGGPAGLAVNASLQLEGTPTVAQAATTYTWRATDADGDTAELTFTIEVQADTDPAFGSGVTIGNQVYVKDVAIAALQLPAASGGNAPLTHELVGGGPAGLAVNASLQLEGTPTAAQAATTYTWRATDADGDTAELTFTIEVQADTDPAFGSGVTIGNQVYVKDVAIAALQLPAASGGNAPLTHELVGGGPAGLAVNASLQLEGTPTVAQAATTYTWRATDADGDTAELTFTSWRQRVRQRRVPGRCLRQHQRRDLHPLDVGLVRDRRRRRQLRALVRQHRDRELLLVRVAVPVFDLPRVRGRRLRHRRRPRQRPRRQVHGQPLRQCRRERVRQRRVAPRPRREHQVRDRRLLDVDLVRDCPVQRWHRGNWCGAEDVAV